jgi:hypothetical protein
MLARDLLLLWQLYTRAVFAPGEVGAILDVIGEDADFVVVAEYLQRAQLRDDYYDAVHARDLAMRQGSVAYLMRPDLHLPEESSWRYIYGQGSSDMALLTLCRLDWASFRYLCAFADQEWIARRHGYRTAEMDVPARGRRYNLDALSCMALALAYMGSTCECKYLQIIFGETEATLSRDLEAGLEQLLHALRRCDAAAIRWPSPEEIERFAELIQTGEGTTAACPIACYPFCFTDGLRLRMWNKNHAGEQNMYYNGWEGCEGVENLITTTPDGCIIDAVLGLPGKWHDKSAAYGLTLRLRDPTQNPNKRVTLADIGLVGRATNDIFATPAFSPADGAPVDAVTRSQFEHWQKFKRQPAEWSMRTLQALWRRITQPLPADDAKRNRLLELAVRLHNFVARVVPTQHNQTRTVYHQLTLLA